MAAASDIALDLMCMMDPVAFARMAGYSADEHQSKVLRSKAKRIILNCTRQWGKSTTAAVRGAHRAIYKPGSLVLCVSPSDRQSGELFDKISSVVKRIPWAPVRTEDNKRSLRLGNSSRIVSLPGSPDTIRGFSAPDLVIVDEAAFVDDALFAAVRPMLIVSGGELDLLSTPYGKRGEFFNVWETGGPEWERHRAPADECPRIKPAELASERREMPDWLFRQEYLCEFVETVDSVFTEEQIQASRATIQGLDI